MLSVAKRACACCGYLTLDGEGLLSSDGIHFGNFQNCDVCGWEDDYASRRDPNCRGSNGITLVEPQESFARVGAYDERLRHNVRAPRPDEIP